MSKQTESKAEIVAEVIVGLLLILIGMLITLIGAVAIIDPVGSKAADDPDPFGTPPSFAESLTITLVGVGITGMGGVLVAGYKFKKKPELK